MIQVLQLHVIRSSPGLLTMVLFRPSVILSPFPLVILLPGPMIGILADLDIKSRITLSMRDYHNQGHCRPGPEQDLHFFFDTR
jgi:hypothetical protein